jgi:arylsulfatase A-like enzyme
MHLPPPLGHSSNPQALPGQLLYRLSTALLIAASLSQAEYPVFAENSTGTPRQPNIIIILADDLGYGDLGCYGQKLIRTPRLDRLATDGMRFTQFYAGSTVCAPSRCVLMTGLDTGHCRVRGNSGANNTVAQMLEPGDVTVAEVLKSASYATGLVGKWGLGMPGDDGVPNKQGFDYFFGYLSQVHAHNHYPDYLWRNAERVALPNVVSPVGKIGGGYATKTVQYADDLFRDEALRFVEEHRHEPFFLDLSFVVPHANNERAKELGDGQEVPDYGPYADRDWNNSLKGQAAMITRMDQHIGTLLDKLHELGLDNNTVVFFSSDNGPHKEGGKQYDPDFFDANGPVSGYKRSLTDGGIRVPLLARWTGHIQPGSVSQQIGYFGDFLATAAELAGTPTPAHLDSISLVPTLLGQPARQTQHEYLYWEFYEAGVSQAVLLEGHWKGIRLRRTTVPIKLYELTSDLAETNDVAEQHPQVVRRIAQIMSGEHVDNQYWKINAQPAINQVDSPGTR